MNGLAGHTGVNAYKNVAHVGGVENASPHKLIDMLLSGALDRIAKAKGQFQRGDVAGRGKTISQTISIIEELRQSLNKQDGGEVAENLDMLYERIQQQLLESNLGNDPQPLEEVRFLLDRVRDGWRQIPSSLHNHTSQ